MANPGKNKLLRWLRIFVNGYNLSGDARTFSELASTYGEVDVTGWSEAVKNYLADMQWTVGVRGFQALLNDAAGGAFTQLKDPGTGLEVSLLFGGGAEPDYGDPAYLLGAAQLVASPAWDGQAAAIGSDFVPDAGAVNGNPWGVVLHPETSRSVTTSGTAHNNGASSANGWQANLHVTVTSGGTWAISIQHSSTGAFAGEEQTLGTFTLNGSAVGSEHLTGAGTVNQYVRARLVRTSGTLTPIITFARL